MISGLSVLSSQDHRSIS
uniref:Uncharacterized protein n=1 Tax=Arundo donax TaxID=35708 RepID=A0A0A9FJ56_ARUDO